MTTNDRCSDARSFDAGRRMRDENVAHVLGLVRAELRVPEGAALLDLGCGTGRLSIPLATGLGCTVVGSDRSRGMLDVATGKEGSGRVGWVQHDAASLPFRALCFDVVFLSHLLHHVDSPPRVMSECLRVLRAGGALIDRYASFDDVKGNPEHRFFPSANRLDAARVPAVDEVERWLRDAGFEEISSVKWSQRTYETGPDRLRAVALRSISVLTLVPDEEFRAGLAALEAHVRSHAQDEWVTHDRLTVTIARKAPAATPADGAR